MRHAAAFACTPIGNVSLHRKFNSTIQPITFVVCYQLFLNIGTKPGRIISADACNHYNFYVSLRVALLH